MLSEYEIPASADTFDIVMSGQVLEHVRKPWVWMKELARVCVPGGAVLTISPVNWPYHEAPVDCWRVYPEGMRALCEDAGLTVELSVFDNFERRPLSWFPGKSYDFWHRPRKRLNRAKGMVGWPFFVFDTVTVARKAMPGLNHLGQTTTESFNREVERSGRLTTESDLGQRP
jgi:SAM-dependent methyltransferase